MTRGTITNKQTGLEITGECIEFGSLYWEFRVDGTQTINVFYAMEWDFTPEPEQIKEGVYVYEGERPEYLVIYKYREGKWRDAHGYTFADQNVDVSELVRLVPEQEA